MDTTVHTTDRTDLELAATITGIVAQRLSTEGPDSPAAVSTDELLILSWMITGELTPLLDETQQRDGALHLQPHVHATLRNCQNALTGPGRDLRVVARRILTGTREALGAR